MGKAVVMGTGSELNTKYTHCQLLEATDVWDIITEPSVIV